MKFILSGLILKIILFKHFRYICGNLETANSSSTYHKVVMVTIRLTTFLTTHLHRNTKFVITCIR